ncbi:hypothetical protein, partial [Campylobacter concisus]|uniref:hypothetical protein n=1 Tax=Campylobacter concisus TaxID=199 RepID=UPI00112FCDA1
MSDNIFANMDWGDGLDNDYDEVEHNWDLYKQKYGLKGYCPVYLDNLEYNWELAKLQWDKNKTKSEIVTREYEGVFIVYDNPDGDFLKNIDRAKKEFPTRKFILKTWDDKKYYFVDLDAEGDEVLQTNFEGYSEKNTLIRLLLFHKYIEKLPDWEKYKRVKYMQQLEYYAMQSQSVPFGEYL